MENNLENFTQWLDSKGLSDRTMLEYLSYYEKFPHEMEGLQDAVTTFINRYKHNVARAFVKNFLTFLGKEEDVKIPKVTGRKKRRVINTLTKMQINMLREELYNDAIKYGVMFDLQLVGGLRREEVVKIKTEDFIGLEEWFENQNEPCKLKIHGKGNRERIILVPPKIMQQVFIWIEYKANLSESETLFNISKWGYWRHLKRAGDKLGIKVYPHLIRHTKASQLRKDGFDLIDIKNFLGHSFLQTTQLYIHESEEETLNRFRNYIINKEED